jgi:hypothetical protein
MTVKEFLFIWTSRDFMSLNAKESTTQEQKDPTLNCGLPMTADMATTSATLDSKSPTLGANKIANATMEKTLSASCNEVHAAAPKWTSNVHLNSTGNLDR